MSEGYTQAEYQRRLAEQRRRDQLEQQRIAQQSQPATGVIEQDKQEQEEIRSGSPVTTTQKQELAISQSLHDVAAKKLETEYKAAAQELDVTYRPKDVDKNLFTRLIQKYGHLSGENVQRIRDAKKTLDQQYRSGQMSLATYQAQINLLKDRLSGVGRLDAEYDSEAVTKFTVTADGKKYTFDNYEDAFNFSIDQQMYPVTYVDRNGVAQTRFFDTPDEATRFINRLEEPSVQAAQYAKFQPTSGAGAFATITADNMLEAIDYLGNLIDVEAANQKLYGSDALAGILYSTGRTYRLGVGLLTGPTFLPQTVYTALTDPKQILDAAAKDPIVTLANLAILGAGGYSAIKSWRASRAARLTFADTQNWAAKLIGGETQKGAVLVEDLGSFINIWERTAENRAFGKSLSTQQYLEMISPESRFGFFPEEIQPTNYSGPAVDLPYRFTPTNPLHPELGGTLEVFRNRAWRDAFTIPTDALIESIPDELDLADTQFIKSLSEWPPAEARLLYDVDGNPYLDFGERTTKLVNTRAALAEYAEIKGLEKAGSGADMKPFTMEVPVVDGGTAAVVEASLDPVVVEPILDTGYSTYTRGQLPNPYYVSSRGMVTGGVVLAPPSAEFYASLSALLSSGDVAGVSASLEKIDADLKLDISVVPVVTLKIPTDELPDIKAINLSISVIESVTEQISEQIQEQLTEQVTEQTTEQAIEEITEQEPILEPVTTIPPPTEPPPPDEDDDRKSKPKPKDDDEIIDKVEPRRKLGRPRRFRVVYGGRTRVVEARSHHEALEKAMRGVGGRHGYADVLKLP